MNKAWAGGGTSGASGPTSAASATVEYVPSKPMGLERTEKELGMNLEKVGIEMLGTCKKVIVLKDDTHVLDVPGDKKAFGERCEQ
ncbi:chaperonin CPN60-2, mitochondrial, partial [Tanacetum coccineum]